VQISGSDNSCVNIRLLTVAATANSDLNRREENGSVLTGQVSGDERRQDDSGSASAGRVGLVSYVE